MKTFPKQKLEDSLDFKKFQEGSTNYQLGVYISSGQSCRKMVVWFMQQKVEALWVLNLSEDGVQSRQSSQKLWDQQQRNHLRGKFHLCSNPWLTAIYRRRLWDTSLTRQQWEDKTERNTLLLGRWKGGKGKETRTGKPTALQNITSIIPEYNRIQSFYNSLFPMSSFQEAAARKKSKERQGHVTSIQEPV